jgi:hypothetical protein
MGLLTKAASWAEDGSLGLFFFPAAPWLVVALGTGGGGGAEGVEVDDIPSLLRFEQTAVLPLSGSVPAPLLAPLVRGHQCLFTDLQDANQHLHHLHFHCGSPSMASSATFWHSHLDTWFLFLVSHFFSFWAAVAHQSPLVRSKKA